MPPGGSPGDLALGDDQRYSLARHHRDEVTGRVLAARPGLAAPPRRPPAPSLRRVPGGFTAGWAAWLGCRRAGLRYRWFRLRARGAYRGAPP